MGYVACLGQIPGEIAHVLQNLVSANGLIKSEVVVVRQLVVCFQDLKFCLSSQLKAASCAWCSSEMPPSKQVNGHSFTICLMVWCSFLSVTHGYGLASPSYCPYI